MGQVAGEPSEGFYLELIHRASRYGDVEAWTAFERGLQELVRGWLHAHPEQETACRVRSEQHVITQAFEHVRQAILQRQFVCETLKEVLIFLHMSLNGAIQEAVRISSDARIRGEGVAVGRNLEGHVYSLEVWNWVQSRLTSEHERRLAYLLYHCGLQPNEIVQHSSQEWSDVHEVKRLRCRIILQLSHDGSG